MSARRPFSSFSPEPRLSCRPVGQTCLLANHRNFAIAHRASLETSCKEECQSCVNPRISCRDFPMLRFGSGHTVCDQRPGTQNFAIVTGLSCYVRVFLTFRNLRNKAGGRTSCTLPAVFAELFVFMVRTKLIA